MFMSFIGGLIFGIGSGYLEKLIAKPLRDQFELSDSELGIISFSALMLVAAILVSAMGVNSSAFWLVLGGAIGAFGIRAYVFGKAEVEKRKLAAQDAAGDLADSASDMADSAADAATDAKNAVKDAAKSMSEPA